MNLVSGTACSRESSGLLAGGGDSVAGAGSGFLAGSGGRSSAEAGPLACGRPGFESVLNLLDRLLTDRDGFVTTLATLAVVNVACDCLDKHLGGTGPDCPVRGGHEQPLNETLTTKRTTITRITNACPRS